MAVIQTFGGLRTKPDEKEDREATKLRTMRAANSWKTRRKTKVPSLPRLKCLEKDVDDERD